MAKFLAKLLDASLKHKDALFQEREPDSLTDGDYSIARAEPCQGKAEIEKSAAKSEKAFWEAPMSIRHCPPLVVI
jgi:hypothetical protein